MADELIGVTSSEAAVHGPCLKHGICTQNGPRNVVSEVALWLGTRGKKVVLHCIVS